MCTIHELIHSSNSLLQPSRSANNTPSTSSSAQDAQLVDEIIDELESAIESSKKPRHTSSASSRSPRPAHTHQTQVYEEYKNAIHDFLYNNSQTENDFIKATISKIKKDLNPFRQLRMDIDKYIAVFQRLKHETLSPKTRETLQEIILQLIDLKLTDENIKLSVVISSLSNDRDAYSNIENQIEKSTPENVGTTITYLKNFCKALLANRIVDETELIEKFEMLYTRYRPMAGKTSPRLFILSTMLKELKTDTVVINSAAVEALLETISQDRIDLANNDTEPEKTLEELAGQEADALIEQCYFSPDMQFAVTSYINDDLFELNVVTGKPKNIPTVYDIIAGNDTTATTSEQKKARIHALQAALEATQLAQFLAGLNVAYANPNYLKFAPTISSNYFMPPLDENLKKALKAREKNLRDALGNNTWWAWITDWSWISTPVTHFFTTSTQANSRIKSYLDFEADYDHINNVENIVAIPSNLMKTIIKNYDYKQIINSKDAANLLFKQCFIAQQQFRNNDWPLYTTPTRSPISATNYIFERFTIDPTGNFRSRSKASQSALNEKHAVDIDQIVNHIKSAVHNKKRSPNHAHALLIEMRKAVQTAMFIANKKSNINIFYTLPSIAVKFLDETLAQLNQYDRMLDNLCQDATLGANREDQARRQTWNTISNILTAGVVVGGIAVAAKSGIAQYAYNSLVPAQTAPAQKNQPASLKPQDNTTASYTSTPAPSKAVNSGVLQVISHNTPVIQSFNDTMEEIYKDLHSKPIENVATPQNIKTETLSLIKNQTNKNIQQTKKFQKNNSQNTSTNLMDYIADMMGSPEFTESRTVPYWQGGGDAEVYGMPGFSQNDVIGTATTAGLGSVARTGYNFVNVGEAAGQGALQGVNNFGKYATTPTAGAHIKTGLEGIKANVTNAAKTETSTKIVEASVPRTMLASADPYIATTTELVANTHKAAKIGATIADTGNIVSKATPIKNAPLKGQAAIVTGLLATTPESPDIASHAPLHTEHELNAMQPFYEQKTTISTEKILSPNNANNKTQFSQNENISKESLHNNIQFSNNNNIAQEELQEA